MRKFNTLAVAAALAGGSAQAVAQPVDLPLSAATTDTFPAGIKVLKTKDGAVYADKKGRVLYGLDLRTVLRWNSNPALYCQTECQQEWEPVLAPAGAVPNIRFPGPGGQPDGDETAAARFVDNRKAPDWTVILGPAGPQWVYKGWHMVFVNKRTKTAIKAADGADNFTWNTLKYVPPTPKVSGPIALGTALSTTGYVLTDKEGRTLFTGTCRDGCAGWTPLAAGMASKGDGQWSVSLAGDRPQWLFRGQPVFVNTGDDPLALPPGATALRP